MARVVLLQAFASTQEAVHIRPRQLVLDSPPGHARLDQDFDGAATLLQPRLQLDDGAGGTLTGVDISTPAVSVSWTVGGSDPGAVRVGDLKISAKLDGGEREWSQAVLAAVGSRFTGDLAPGPLGWEVTRGGPPPGEDVPVDFVLNLYGFPSGATASLPLLTTGYVTGSGRDYTDAGHILELEGRGPEILWQDVEIDLKQDSDHGFTQGELGILACGQAGMPAALIGIDPGIGEPRTIAFEYGCTPLWQVLEDIFRPIGYQVIAGIDDGVFRAIELVPGADTPALMSLKAGPGGDLEGAKLFSVKAQGRVPVCAEVVGASLDEAIAGKDSGVVTASVVIEVWDDNFVLPIAIASQGSSVSTITPTGISPPAPKRTLISRTTIEVTTEDGCEILTYTLQEGFYNPKAARYLANNIPDGGSPGNWLYPLRSIYFFDSIPTADDSTEGFLWKEFRFTRLSEQWVRPQWRDDGRRVGTITATAGWKNPAASIKNRLSAGSTWETQNYVSGRPLTASGAGIFFQYEHYFAGPASASSESLAIPGDSYGGPVFYDPISTKVHGEIILRYLTYAVETRTISDDDYEVGVSTDSTTWGIRNGVLFLYSSGEGGVDSEVGLTSNRTEVRSQIAGKPTTVETATDEQGVSLPSKVTRGGGRGLPAAEICTDELVDQNRKTDFTVEVCVARDDGAGVLVPIAGKPLRLQSDFIETREEAQRWGLRELQILRSFPAELRLASPCPVLDVGNVVEIDVPELHPSVVLAPVWERELTIPGERDGRVEDVVVVLLPPFA